MQSSPTKWRDAQSDLEVSASSVFEIHRQVHAAARPNLLASGDLLFAFDHEQAFSFLAGVIGWQPPWTGQGLDFNRNHVYYHQLNGLTQDWNRLKGALGALTDARLNEYLNAVPAEWRANNNAVQEIIKYLRQVRENRETLFGVISRLLQ
ncbi:MAG: hypothetical protein AB9869_36270 [Verrucomicrobiia bacterium]